MNWAKGRRTRGRGASFKGALDYALHDKGATTADRVGFVELLNLATDNPNRAWSEMMALCDAANDLKKRAGVASTGNKMKRPVYAFTLGWHEADHPSASHMRQTALDALKTLGMEGLQAVLIEHTDRPHKHVHIIVNLIDPDTGKAVSLSNDEHKLDRWANNYEIAQGVIRSPARHAKFHALDNGIKPPKRPAQAKTREEWQATRKLQGEHAHQRAAEIRTEYAAHVAAMKERQRATFAARREESDRLWKGYRADRSRTTERYQPFIDVIWKSRRKGPPHPFTEQALRDLQETAEWKELGKQQFQQRRSFDARERSALGVIANIIRLQYGQFGSPGLSGLFKLMVSGNERHRQFQKLQEMQKQGLRDRQGASRKVRADTLHAARRHELAQLSQQYEKDRRAMVVRHAATAASQRAEWKHLASERDRVWTEYRRDQLAPAPEREEIPLPVSAVEPFRDAANPPRPAERSSADGGRAIEAKLPPDRKADAPPEIAPDGRTPTEQIPARGWRARRSAEERRADGSYRPRTRTGKRDGPSEDNDRGGSGGGKDKGGRGRERGRSR